VKRSPVLLPLAATAMLGALGCSGGESYTPTLGPATFKIEITGVNGGAPPPVDMPLTAQVGLAPNHWDFTIQAISSTGAPITDFHGFVHLSVQPGAVDSIVAPGAVGRNVQLVDGKVAGTVQVEAVYGPARLWVEDLGYTPAPMGKAPACSDGKDNNSNGLIDFPADPGCAYADDDDENGSSYSAGVSPPVAYDLPKISDVRGAPLGGATPYRNDGVDIKSDAPETLVVTHVSSNGFYVTDVNPTEQMNGNNSVFAFYFATPPGMRVCDTITSLSGTANDFFGFTEVSFPSWTLTTLVKGVGTCLVPEPVLLGPCATGHTCPTLVSNGTGMQKYESSLVRVEGFKIAKHFGPQFATHQNFQDNASNCDFTGDGKIDFTNPDEATCATTCDSLPDCSEWTSFSGRNTYKISSGTNMILIDTSTIVNFDPTANRGQVIDAVSGTMRKFSGGTLNWTIETRCPDDLACAYPGCVAAPVSSQSACVNLRTLSNPDDGSN